MKKKDRSRKEHLEKDEEELLDSFERGEWQTVKKVEKEKKAAMQAARKTLSKDVRINIRLSGTDVANIKEMAAYEGLPYQTLIASILHKYAAGHLQYNHR